MPAVAKKGKASTDQVIHGTKVKKTNQKDLKKQMKKITTKSTELVTDSSDGTDVKVKMDPMENTSDSPKVVKRFKKSLTIDVPEVMEITTFRKLMTALEDGLSPICHYGTLYIKEADDARAAQEKFNKEKLDGEALNVYLPGCPGRDKKSLFIEMPDALEIENYRKLLTALETSSYPYFKYDIIVHKQQEEAMATQERLRKVEIDGIATRCQFDYRTPIRDRKALHIQMPNIEIENCRQLLTALETANGPVAQYLTIVHEQQSEARATQKRLGKVELDGKETQCSFDYRTPVIEKTSLDIEMPDIMEIENQKKFLTALETANDPLFQYVSIFINEEEDAKSTYAQLSKVKIDGRPVVLAML